MGSMYSILWGTSHVEHSMGNISCRAFYGVLFPASHVQHSMGSISCTAFYGEHLMYSILWGASHVQHSMGYGIHMYVCIIPEFSGVKVFVCFPFKLLTNEDHVTVIRDVVWKTPPIL